MEITKKPIKITETILRDAHQSLIATRMTTEQMLPIVDKMDQVGHQRPQPPGTAGETDHLGLLHAGLLQGKPPQHRGPDVCDLSHNQPPLWGCGALSRPHAAIIS